MTNFNFDNIALDNPGDELIRDMTVEELLNDVSAKSVALLTDKDKQSIKNSSTNLNDLEYRAVLLKKSENDTYTFIVNKLLSYITQVQVLVKFINDNFNALMSLPVDFKIQNSGSFFNNRYSQVEVPVYPRLQNIDQVAKLMLFLKLKCHLPAVLYFNVSIRNVSVNVMPDDQDTNEFLACLTAKPKYQKICQVFINEVEKLGYNHILNKVDVTFGWTTCNILNFIKVVD